MPIRIQTHIIIIFVMFAAAFVAVPLHDAHAAVSEWQKGAIITPSSPEDYAGEEFKKSIRELTAVNANFVTLTVPYYQDSTDSTDIKTGWNTPTDEALAAGINYAHSMQLKVMLRITLNPLDGSWHAFINPPDRNAWFASYGRMLGDVGTLATRTGVEQICIGTELGFMTSETANYTNTRNWKKLIAGLRKIYPGKLTYGAHFDWPEERNQITFWTDLDYIGVGGYHPLSPSYDRPSVSLLKNDWETWYVTDMKKIQEKYGKPLIFTDAGYRSIANAHRQPWIWELGEKHPPDEKSQAAAYQALFEYWDTIPEFAGVHFREWEISPSAAGSGAVSYSPQGKLALKVMEDWFGSPMLFAHVYPSNRRPASGSTVVITADIRNDSKEPVRDFVAIMSIVATTGETIYSAESEPFNLSPSSSVSQTWQWAPGSAGTYSVRLEIFDRNMIGLKLLNNRADVLTVNSYQSRRIGRRNRLPPSRFPQISIENGQEEGYKTGDTTLQ